MRWNRQKHSHTHICLAYLISSKQQPCSPAGSPSPVIMNICGVWLCTWDECVHECQTCVLLDHELLSLDGIKGAVLWKKMIVFVKLLSHVKLHHGSDFRPIHMKHNNCKDNFKDYIGSTSTQDKVTLSSDIHQIICKPTAKSRSKSNYSWYVLQSPNLNQMICDSSSKIWSELKNVRTRLVPIWIKLFMIRMISSDIQVHLKKSRKRSLFFVTHFRKWNPYII